MTTRFSFWDSGRIADTILYSFPYGKGFWQALFEWPAEFSYTLQSIVRFASFDCDGTWNVFIETLKPPAGQLFIALLDFGWDDVLRGFLRPIGIRSRRSFRKGRKRGRKRSIIFDKIPEIGEEIGEHLPGARLVKGRQVGSLQRWIWRIDGVLQKGAFYWMLVDLVSDFAYGWLIGIMRHEACWTVGEGWVQSGPGSISFLAGDWVWLPRPQPLRYGGVEPPISAFVNTKSGRRYYFVADVASVDVIAGSADEIEIQFCKLDENNNVIDVIDTSKPLPIYVTDEKSLASIGVVDEPARYAFRVRATPGASHGWGVVRLNGVVNNCKFVPYPPYNPTES